MCLASMETETRRIRKGDAATIGMVYDYHGNQMKAAVPVVQQRGVACYCIKDGLELSLSGLPPEFMHNHALISDTALVIFREANGETRKLDQIEFANTEVVNFDDLPIGVGLKCAGKGKKRAKVAIVEPEIQAHNVVITPEAEPELVGVGVGSGECLGSTAMAANHRNRVHTGVLASTTNRVGAGIGMTMMLVIGIATALLR